MRDWILISIIADLIMGAVQIERSNIGMVRGYGLRVLCLKPDSPLQGKINPFFDFIIDVACNQESERTPRQILSKLTGEAAPEQKIQAQSFQSMIAKLEGQPVTFKCISTKHRKIFEVEAVPNRNWGDQADLLGLSLRQQRYDEAFDTYFPFSEIKPNSPAQKAGLSVGEYLIASPSFKYASHDEFMERIYEHFYDPQVVDKTVKLAVYNIKTDELRVVGVPLARNWGGKGLIGCQFTEGHLARFPRNLQERRQEILVQSQATQNHHRIKQQLLNGSGPSKEIVESLKVQKSARLNSLKQIRSILVAPPIPRIPKAANHEQSLQELRTRVACIEGVLEQLRNHISQAIEQSDDIL